MWLQGIQLPARQVCVIWQILFPILSPIILEGEQNISISLKF